MGIALKLAKEAKDISFPNPMVGAVLVKNNKIIGKGNTKEPGNNHAEISAINDAKRNFPSNSEEKIKGSSLYVTLEPCEMCAAAISAARISKVIFGASSTKYGGLPIERADIRVSNFHKKLEIYGGFYEKEIVSLMEKFFAEKRVIKNGD